jgi:hypothetical protein
MPAVHAGGAHLIACHVRSHRSLIFDHLGSASRRPSAISAASHRALRLSKVRSTKLSMTALMSRKVGAQTNSDHGGIVPPLLCRLLQAARAGAYRPGRFRLSNPYDDLLKHRSHDDRNPRKQSGELVGATSRTCVRWLPSAIGHTYNMRLRHPQTSIAPPLLGKRRAMRHVPRINFGTTAVRNEAVAESNQRSSGRCIPKSWTERNPL